MSFYRNTVYPVLVDRLGNPEPIRRLRREIVPLARGTVLEIGLGSGANCPYYDASNVRRLYALEPNAGNLRDGHPYDVRKDGQRFLMPASVDPRGTPPITVILNWESTLPK